LLCSKKCRPQQKQTFAGCAELEIKSILLLDDDIDLADTLKLLLESRNYVVTTVKNGVEGLHEIMAFDFDIVMCDMLMPSMPGDMFTSQYSARNRISASDSFSSPVTARIRR